MDHSFLKVIAMAKKKKREREAVCMCVGGGGGGKSMMSTYIAAYKYSKNNKQKLNDLAVAASITLLDNLKWNRLEQGCR